MLSAQLPKPASASGMGFVRNGVGSAGLAASVASHVATSAGGQFTVMAPPSDGPLAEGLLPGSGFGVAVDPAGDAEPSAVGVAVDLEVASMGVLALGLLENAELGVAVAAAVLDVQLEVVAAGLRALEVVGVGPFRAVLLAGLVAAGAD